MTNILLLRLAAPMQSWGVMSRFSRRDTGKEPSKSGVIGLLCAALGISREEANAETNELFAEMIKLKMGVRVLREGVLQTDYHTAQRIAIASGGTPKETEISTRFYLADADFVVGLAGDKPEILETVQNALQNPKWQLFLGRKAFAPALPVCFSESVFSTAESLGDFMKSDALTKLLESYDEKFDRKGFDGSPRQRLIIEDAEKGTETRQDVPLSFAERRFTIRRVLTEFIDLRKGGEKE